MTMNRLYQFFSSISQYRDVIGLLALIVGTIVVLILVGGAISKMRAQLQLQREAEQMSDLKNIDYDKVNRTKKTAILKNVVAPDGVDPGPNSYTVVSDGGNDVYVRTLTMVRMPRRVRFANTFSGLLDFPNCTSSIFVSPISEEAMIHKMDKHITVLSSEYVGAEGDINRQRKLNAQMRDANNFAEQVESGENRFFNVGFVFTLHADTVRELNKQTSLFVSKAKEKNMFLSSCFGVQAEAYAQNAPLNRSVMIGSHFIKNDAIHWFNMDKYSVSTLYNYTQSSYSHTSGIALGRDMFTAAPILFDIYDASHDGFTMVIVGKTGCGKSATIKMMCCRQALHGYHFVAIDSQARKGVSEGEYAGIAELLDGVNFKISNSSNEIMNIFEVSESTATKKGENNEIYEVRSLDLADKIIMVANILSTMVRGTKDKGKVDIPVEMDTYINRILIDNVTQMYKNFGIEDGDPDSLYTQAGNPLAADKGITSGRVVKILPTFTDFYKQLLVSNRDNTDPTLQDAYNVVLMSLVDYVKELYYSNRSCHFFTREQVMRMPYAEGTKAREFVNDMRQKESIVEIHGIRAYYDGQSSIHINKDCTFTNIDISQLNDDEKILARQVAMDFVNENFIKKNSENLHSADKLVCIFDECHELFNLPYTRQTLDGVVRTARKRNVAVTLSSQTLKEYDNHPETQAILKQAAVKFVFKQDYQDRQYLMDSVGLTAAQTDFILNNLGGNPSDESDKNRHRGEVCIIDNKQVAFCKVDYRKETEALPVETDARGIEALFTLSA